MCNVAGVTVSVHISCSPPVGSAEERLAKNINGAATAAKNKCAPNVDELVQLYRQTSVESEKSRIEQSIYDEYFTLLKGMDAQWHLKRKQAEMLTKMSLGDIRVELAVMSSSMILYCGVSTVEALWYLQQMIDSGELSELFSSMLSFLANTEVVATVSLPPQEYDAAFALLNSAAGKDHLVIIVLMYKTITVDM